MNFKTWAPLWSGIVDSSVWDEPDHVVKVFLTMLALKDADHVVRMTAYQISKRSKKTEQEVLGALTILSSPDSKRMEPQPFEGRRIESVEDGWLVLNGEKYRAMVRSEMLRAKNRRAQEVFRAKKKALGGTARERKFQEAVQNGDEAEASRLTDSSLDHGAST